MTGKVRVPLYVFYCYLIEGFAKMPKGVVWVTLGHVANEFVPHKVYNGRKGWLTSDSSAQVKVFDFPFLFCYLDVIRRSFGWIAPRRSATRHGKVDDKPPPQKRRWPGKGTDMKKPRLPPE